MKLSQFNALLESLVPSEAAKDSFRKLGPKQQQSLLGPEIIFPQWQCKRTITDNGDLGKSVQHEIGPFTNGRSVSIIKGAHTYGGQSNLWEIAPRGTAKQFIGRSILDWEDDVKGHLTLAQVKEWCETIEKL